MTTPRSVTEKFANKPAALARRSAAVVALSLLLLSVPGCQNISGSTPVAEIRIIDASPDAGPVDVYQGTNILAFDLGFQTITSYVQVTPGTYGLLVDVNKTTQTLVSAQGTLQAGNQYTVLIGNYLNSLQETILKDQSTAAPSGQIDVRFLDQSQRGGAFDIYLVPSGSTLVQVKPILTNVTFNTNTGYFTVPSGTYTLVAEPAGTVPTATGTTSYTGSSVVYAGGAARTFILMDQQVITSPGITVITGNDYDSPSSTI
jgi:hypothetical protein